MTAGVWYLDPNGSWQPRAERTPMPPPGEPGERLARVLPLRPPDPEPDAGWAVPGVEPETCDSGEERLSRSSRAALAEIADAVTAHRLAGARVYRAILALEGSDAVAESGYRDLPRLLSDHVRLDPAESRRLARHAEALHPTVTPAGATLEPDLPATSTVVDHGEAGDGHVEVIRKTMTRLRGVEDLPAEVLATTEEQLAQLARTHCPAALTRAAVVIADRLDPDGAAPAEDPAPENELTYTRRKNGHLHAKTILRDPVAAELFDQAIRGATLPPQSAAVVDPDTGQPPTGADGARGEDPQIEARESKPSRQAAALMDLIEAGHAAGLDEPGDPDEPDGQREFGGPDNDDVHPGEDPGGNAESGVDDDPGAGPATDAGLDGPVAPPPRPAPARARDVPSLQLTVTVDFDTLRDQLADRSKALALLEDTTWIRPETVRRLACDAEIIPMVMGSKGEVLDVGRKTRNPPAGLRRAVRRRDRHCAFPGCRRRARHTQVHHIAHWGHGGETELDNLVCLCGYHHTLVHHSGWEIVMDQRMPWFIPPKWLDPTRTPRHNRPWTIEAA
ncbi:HNH endonuclease signature motif containing protein [Actinomycetospora termitidis]|uniref:DUF222 domain-containing protein n=1 Tax=Actinomycetospora termitidis TaxID=3053470 RepID=A0ABT7M6F9_9PSEU|nr:HNH endonuclease signature motif containing protein [Actinomycetospora sp. Odt1-22]MDL5156241.1 DUF222 domain-containing protein [Actinomycetospora sp. Odt1-22]